MRLCLVLLCHVCFYSAISGYLLRKAPIPNPRICIIGAGIAGLTSGKSLQDEGFNFTILEATEHFGGTWRYEPRVGYYDNGLPIFSSMYKHLRTNLPKPTMELKGFPIPEDMPSYPTWEMYYGYLKNYVKHFDLEKYIKYQHHVIGISRVGNAWKVKHKYVPSGEVYVDEYDYVIIGTGHFSAPNRPNITGEDIFKGTIIHSHDYREPEPYKGQNVIIVGAGPSGMDITLDIATVAKTVYHSHHSKIKYTKTKFPNNYVEKPDIEEFNEKGALFADGTYEDVDAVIYCTGYLFDYAFCDESTDLTLRPKTVTPLHKYMVNINQPTMIIVGLVEKACLVTALEAQARYTAALIKGKFSLPSKEEMMKEWQMRADKCLEKGRSFNYLHFLAESEDEYYEELSKESGIERVPPVMFKIRSADMLSKANLYTYRNYSYRVIDNNTFERTLEVDTDSNNIEQTV